VFNVGSKTHLGAYLSIVPVGPGLRLFCAIRRVAPVGSFRIATKCSAEGIGTTGLGCDEASCAGSNPEMQYCLAS
jgi:hypothetical protein